MKEVLKKIFDSLEIDNRYARYREDEAPKVPFAVYYLEETENFYADGVPFYEESSYIVDVYFDEKDEIKELEIEKELTNRNIGWNKKESYLEGEDLIVISYVI